MGALPRPAQTAGWPRWASISPGHGFVRADSHAELPVDERPLAALEKDDLVPFGALVRLGIEAHHAGPRRLSGGRQRTGGIFAGLAPGGAARKARFRRSDFQRRSVHGGCAGVRRRRGARRGRCAAGCDMVLVCNEPEPPMRCCRAGGRRPQPDLARRAARMAHRAAVVRGFQSCRREGRQRGERRAGRLKA